MMRIASSGRGCAPNFPTPAGRHEGAGSAADTQCRAVKMTSGATNAPAHGIGPEPSMKTTAGSAPGSGMPGTGLTISAKGTAPDAGGKPASAEQAEHAQETASARESEALVMSPLSRKTPTVL